MDDFIVDNDDYDNDNDDDYHWNDNPVKPRKSAKKERVKKENTDPDKPKAKRGRKKKEKDTNVNCPYCDYVAAQPRCLRPHIEAGLNILPLQSVQSAAHILQKIQRKYVTWENSWEMKILAIY